MTQKIEALLAEDAHSLEQQRTWVRDHYEPDARDQYETIEGKLRLLDTIIRANWIDPTETWKLQSLGITFGDALFQEMGLSWVVVEDEYGRDPQRCTTTAPQSWCFRRRQSRSVLNAAKPSTSGNYLARPVIRSIV